jgi:hypothetical protein
MVPLARISVAAYRRNALDRRQVRGHRQIAEPHLQHSSGKGSSIVELGRHLGKGIWGLADKALPVVYGLGYVLLVIRVLPEVEFGNWVLLQEIFLLVSGLATAFALNPLLAIPSAPRCS